MSRVSLTIHLDLEMANIPSHDALNAAMQRAEAAAARVFLNGDLGGEMHVTIDPSPNPIPQTCGALTVLPGRMFASVGRQKRPSAPRLKSR